MTSYKDYYEGSDKVKKKLKKDGINYNRKFNRWELWSDAQIIYFYNIDTDENHMDSYRKMTERTTELFGYHIVNPDTVPVKEITKKEFEGNVLVTVSGEEVRLWVCNDKGENIFRFKALGEVHQGGNDIMVIAK